MTISQTIAGQGNAQVSERGKEAAESANNSYEESNTIQLRRGKVLGKKLH